MLGGRSVPGIKRAGERLPFVWELENQGEGFQGKG